MKLNLRAMFVAVGIGLVFELVMAGVRLGISTATDYAMGDLTSVTDPQQFLSFLATSYGSGVGFGCVLICVGFLLYGLIGAIYGWLAHRAQGIIDVSQTALGGGISAAIVSTISLVMSAAINMLLLILATESITSEQIASLADERIDLVGMLGGIMVFGCCLACITNVILPGGVGAAGGAIYAGIAGQGGHTQNATPERIEL